MNSSPTTTMKAVYETDDADEANKRIQQGWNLLGVFQRATVIEYKQEAWVLYVLGKPGPAAVKDSIWAVEEAWNEKEANRLLGEGCVMLFTYIHKGDDGGEYPRFVFGKPSSATQPKFTGNGVH